jgi:hypothetical protein
MDTEVLGQELLMKQHPDSQECPHLGKIELTRRVHIADKRQKLSL